MKNLDNAMNEEQLENVNGGLFGGMFGHQAAAGGSQHNMTCPKCGKKFDFFGTEEDWNGLLAFHKNVCPNQ